MTRTIPSASLVLLLAATGCTPEQLQDLLFDTYLVRLNAEPAEVVTTVNNIATVFEIEPIHVFELATQGFSVDLPIGVADEIASWDEVRYVVIDNPDTYTHPPTSTSPSWVTAESPRASTASAARTPAWTSPESAWRSSTRASISTTPT